MRKTVVHLGHFLSLPTPSFILATVTASGWFGRGGRVGGWSSRFGLFGPLPTDKLRVELCEGVSVLLYVVLGRGVGCDCELGGASFFGANRLASEIGICLLAPAVAVVMGESPTPFMPMWSSPLVSGSTRTVCLLVLRDVWMGSAVVSPLHITLECCAKKYIMYISVDENTRFGSVGGRGQSASRNTAECHSAHTAVMDASLPAYFRFNRYKKYV